MGTKNPVSHSKLVITGYNTHCLSALSDLSNTTAKCKTANSHRIVCIVANLVPEQNARLACCPESQKITATSLLVLRLLPGRSNPQLLQCQLPPRVVVDVLASHWESSLSASSPPKLPACNNKNVTHDSRQS